MTTENTLPDSVTKLHPFSDKDLKRFWSKVNKDGPVPAHMPHLGKCWIWTGAGQTRNRNAWYGIFWYKNANPGAHRISYQIHHGPIPEKMHVCHKCDFPRCVNPSHIFAGTSLENEADKKSKGRQAKGETSGRVTHPEKTLRGEQCKHSILKEHQVKEIRNLRHYKHLKSRKIAEILGIRRELVEGVLWKKIWVHITPDFQSPYQNPSI